MTHGIFELALVLLLAASLGVIARLLKQPLFIAYLTTGLLIGHFHYSALIQQDFLKVFSEFGVMFLLFLVGLEVNYSSIRSVGKIALVLGLGQIIFTFS